MNSLRKKLEFITKLKKSPYWFTSKEGHVVSAILFSNSNIDHFQLFYDLKIKQFFKFFIKCNT